MPAAVAALVVLGQLFLTGCSPKPPPSLKTLSSEETTQITGKPSVARALCIGEAHTVAHHHNNQLKIIRELHDNVADIAIGLEMFPFTSQTLLDNWINGSLSLEAFTTGYYQSWQIPFSNYEKIFQYAREEKIPLLGLNLPKTISTKMARQGFHALNPEEKEALPAAIDCQPNTAQMLLLRNILASRGDDGTLFKRFCEAHTLRDKTMALYGWKYLDDNPGTTLVILAGINHCMKQGAPGYLEEMSGSKTLVILPAAAEQVLKQEITLQQADYLLAE